jgi:hypothetical protein
LATALLVHEPSPRKQSSRGPAARGREFEEPFFTALKGRSFFFAALEEARKHSAISSQPKKKAKKSAKKCGVDGT